MGKKNPAEDEESAAADKPRMKRQLSSGQLLVDDPGVLGPFNRLVWAHPNSALYILLVIGAITFFPMKQNGYLELGAFNSPSPSRLSFTCAPRASPIRARIIVMSALRRHLRPRRPARPPPSPRALPSSFT